MAPRRLWPSSPSTFRTRLGGASERPGTTPGLHSAPMADRAWVITGLGGGLISCSLFLRTAHCAVDEPPHDDGENRASAEIRDTGLRAGHCAEASTSCVKSTVAARAAPLLPEMMRARVPSRRHFASAP